MDGRGLKTGGSREKSWFWEVSLVKAEGKLLVEKEDEPGRGEGEQRGRQRGI